MKYNETEFKNLVTKLYDGEIEIVGKFTGLSYPILIKDKYGILLSQKSQFDFTI